MSVEEEDVISRRGLIDDKLTRRGRGHALTTPQVFVAVVAVTEVSDGLKPAAHIFHGGNELEAVAQGTRGFNAFDRGRARR